ncbi:hypothetical protein EXIGLDRAFT_831371 [Exidia glandulosa HHB12029]|uniref:F-box domain-containing protein n=1 Tax=Exidia glandulosa HHB12029 TaxID=1314781 RepID=A0A165MR66_EXIGL|nr:hypothetical protein EXIGLDRAFT_831371 [Exidia glandulosa HHB12029]
MAYNSDNCKRVVGAAEEVVIINAKRGNHSRDTQLAAGAFIIALGDDVTRLVFHRLPISGRISASHVCAFWRWLAVGDPLLWTTLHGPRTVIPVLWSRAGSAPVDVWLNFLESAIDDILSCLSAHLSRMRSLNITTRGYEVDVEDWQRILDALCQPAPSLSRLHLEGPYDPTCVRGVFPSAALQPRGTASRIQKLALIRTAGLDFSLLPPTLTHLALGDTSWCECRLTFRELQTLLRQCPGLRDLWLNVQADMSYAELDKASRPPLALRKLTLALDMDTELPLTQRVLEYLAHDGIHFVDVYNAESDPAHGIFHDVQASSMSIQIAKYFVSHCADVTVTDTSNRLRRVSAANYLELRQSPRLWDTLTTLTVYGDPVKQLARPPPPVPRLVTLRVFWSRNRLYRTIDSIAPWRLIHEGLWQCPALRVLELAVGTPAGQHEERRSQAGPVVIILSTILHFVARELSSGDVERVILRGGFNVLLNLGTHEQIPFELRTDLSPVTIPRLDTDPVFNGFDRDV